MSFQYRVSPGGPERVWACPEEQGARCLEERTRSLGNSPHSPQDPGFAQTHTQKVNSSRWVQRDPSLQQTNKKPVIHTRCSPRTRVCPPTSLLTRRGKGAVEGHSSKDIENVFPRLPTFISSSSSSVLAYREGARRSTHPAATNRPGHEGASALQRREGADAGSGDGASPRSRCCHPRGTPTPQNQMQKTRSVKWVSPPPEAISHHAEARPL